MRSAWRLASLAFAGLLMGVTAAQDQSAFQQQPLAVPQIPASLVPQLPNTGERPSMRLLFAQSLAAAAQSLGVNLIGGLTVALTGGLTGWLERKARRRSDAPTQFAQQTSLPQPAEQSPSFATAQTAATPVQFFDAQTGQPTAPDSNLTNATTVDLTPTAATATERSQAKSAGATAAPAQPANTTLDLFAGLAFEVHSLDVNGATSPVNPATHDFRTGDQFVIFFRPTLPGRMEVYNINASGQQTQIDLQVIAAGQLARLGPYQFAAQTGDEQLKLVIVPCTSQALAIATRDIVNVAAGAPSANGPNNALSGSAATTDSGLALITCTPTVRSIGRVRTRDIRTRDIQRVAVEGGTGFALDEVSAQERATGQLAPREVTILMRHR